MINLKETEYDCVNWMRLAQGIAIDKEYPVTVNTTLLLTK